MTQDRRLPVVGVDASEAALRATRFAADEARRQRVPLRIVHAMSRLIDSLAIPPTDLDAADQLRAGAATATQWAADSVAGDGPEIRTSVEEGDPVAVLREASGEAQLVVLGSRAASVASPGSSWGRRGTDSSPTHTARWSCCRTRRPRGCPTGGRSSSGWRHDAATSRCSSLRSPRPPTAVPTWSPCTRGTTWSSGRRTDPLDRSSTGRAWPPTSSSR